MGGVKEVIEVKAVCFANHRRSSVSLDNTIQAIHNSQFIIGRLGLCCRARTLDLLSFYFFTFLLLKDARPPKLFLASPFAF